MPHDDDTLDRVRQATNNEDRLAAAFDHLRAGLAAASYDRGEIVRVRTIELLLEQERSLWGP